MILVIQHAEIEGPGTLEIFFRQRQSDFKVIDLSKISGPQRLTKVAFPNDLSKLEALVVLGGSMNVYQEAEFPFLRPEIEFLKRVVAQNIPVLGICLGAQLLARVFKAGVFKAPVREIGWSKISLCPEAFDDPLLKGFGDRLDVFQWHDDTFELPSGAKLLARGKECRNQAVRFSESVWGLQFHPEVNLKMLKNWCCRFPGEVNKDKILFGYFDRQEKYLHQAKTIYTNFTGIIANRRSQVEV